jgi:hypothetical protein
VIALQKRDRLLLETVSKVMGLFPVPLWLELIFSPPDLRGHMVSFGVWVKLSTDAVLLASS